jgi:hypothetical protein
MQDEHRQLEVSEHHVILGIFDSGELKHKKKKTADKGDYCSLRWCVLISENAFSLLCCSHFGLDI